MANIHKAIDDFLEELKTADEENRTASLIDWIKNEDFDLNETDAEGFTPLTRILRLDMPNFIRPDEQLAIVKELVDKGADINRKDSRGNTPLPTAAKFGCQFAILKLLKNQDTDLDSLYNATITRAETKWANVGQHVREDIIAKIKAEIDLLVGEEGEDLLNSKPPADGESPFTTYITHAMNRGGLSLPILKYLIEKGADPAMDMEDRDALWYAAGGGNKEITRYLLENYAEYLDLDAAKKVVQGEDDRLLFPLWGERKEEILELIEKAEASRPDVVRM